MASYDTKEMEIKTDATTEVGKVAEVGEVTDDKSKKLKKAKKVIDDEDEDSDDSEGSLVDFIVKDDMSESDVDDDEEEKSLNDESEIKELFQGLESMDCANLLESSNYDNQGLRRSSRRRTQPMRFTEQYAADIAKTMLDDIPDDEIEAALMDDDSLADESLDSEDGDFKVGAESDSESSSESSSGSGSDSDDKTECESDFEADETSNKSGDDHFKTPESKKSKLTLPGGHKF